MTNPVYNFLQDITPSQKTAEIQFSVVYCKEVGNLKIIMDQLVYNLQIKYA